MRRVRPSSLTGSRAAALAVLLAWIVASGTHAAAQSRGAGRTPPPATTVWGDPDLQGIWPGGSVYSVPFERDPELGTRATLTEAEAAKRNLDIDAQSVWVLANYWPELGHAPPLASLIVEPENGRLPSMTEDGARRAEEWRTKTADGYYPRGYPAYMAAGPADLRPYDRCITRGVLGSAFPNQYGSGMQIHQAPGFVVIRYEMVHEARIIPLDARPHISSAIRSYMGDSRGRWEGDTLVVETTNFNGRTGSYARNGNGNPTSVALRLVERFRLRDRDTLHYEVLVEDPRTWVRPWKVAFPLRRDDRSVLYEYACHEGNYAMRNILSAARSAER